MSSSFEPVLVYGFIQEDDNDIMIDPNFLKEYDIQYFAQNIVNGCATKIIYGI